MRGAAFGSAQLFNRPYTGRSEILFDAPGLWLAAMQ